MTKKKGLTMKDCQAIFDKIIKTEVEKTSSTITETLESIIGGGYVPEYLLETKKGIVRKYLASLGLYLDVLVNDPYDRVREEVAKQGYGLDVLVNDRIASVRAQVARQGYKLELLVNDKSPSVRIEVAKRGYGLDVLCNDHNIRVKRAAETQFKKSEIK